MPLIRHLAGALALACLMPCAVLAQSYPPIVAPGTVTPPQGVAFKGANGETIVVSQANPLPVTGGTGGGGGSTPTGTAGSPTPYVVTVQGITGAVAVPVTFTSAPLPTGAATVAKQDQLLTALGSPLQAGGTIGGITGPVTLPTGAATANNQATANSSLASIDGKLATLGPKAAAGSQSVAPATDAVFAVDTVRVSTSVNRGASVGTTAVQLMPANAARRGVAYQNQSTTATCYVSGLAAATADFNSLMIPPGGYWESPPTHVGTGAISAICTAASTPLYAREW